MKCIPVLHLPHFVRNERYYHGRKERKGRRGHDPFVGVNAHFFQHKIRNMANDPHGDAETEEGGSSVVADASQKKLCEI